MSLRKLRANPHGIDLGPLRPGFPQKLKTRDKRVQLIQDVVVTELPALVDLMHSSAVGNGDELLMIGRRHLRSNNSWMHNTARLTKGKARHQLLAHPDDLAHRGIEDGSMVSVTSAAGTVDIEVAASEKMMPGVVSMPHGFGHQRPGVNCLLPPQCKDRVSTTSPTRAASTPSRPMRSSTGPWSIRQVVHPMHHRGAGFCTISAGSYLAAWGGSSVG